MYNKGLKVQVHLIKDSKETFSPLHKFAKSISSDPSSVALLLVERKSAEWGVWVRRWPQKYYCTASEN